MTTSLDLSQLVGREADYPVKDMTIRVRVANAREVWGNTHVQIMPLAGSGLTWVALDSVRLVDQQPRPNASDHITRTEWGVLWLYGRPGWPETPVQPADDLGHAQRLVAEFSDQAQLVRREIKIGPWT
jgi:hypothetical protein